jgi:hypothetical protein
VRGRFVVAGATGAALFASAVAAAQEQVEFTVRPPVARLGARVVLEGSIASGKQNEVVRIEKKECDPRSASFRLTDVVRTGIGGGWSTEFLLNTATTFRARWARSTSPEVTVRPRPDVRLRRRPGRGFDIGVRALSNFVGKRVVLQRYDRRLQTWAFVKSVALRESRGGGAFVATQATLRASLPKRTLVRAVLPRLQARPCYVAGYSNLLRT